MINLIIETQPDDESCGPTSLHAVYAYYGLDVSLPTMIKTIDRSLSGGTLDPMLGKHALQMGFDATIYVYNLNLFDPSWFKTDTNLSERLIEKLHLQLEYKPDVYIAKATQAYLDFLSLGGKIRFQTLSVELLKEYFIQKIPIITGLSATYLYRTPRERFTIGGKSIYDDIRGTPCGHFVVLCGYDDQHRHVVVADPSKENPLSHDNYYKVSSRHLINAIMLGVLTYDANLLIIEPKKDFHANSAGNG